MLRSKKVKPYQIEMKILPDLHLLNLKIEHGVPGVLWHCKISYEFKEKCNLSSMSKIVMKKTFTSAIDGMQCNIVN